MPHANSCDSTKCVVRDARRETRDARRETRNAGSALLGGRLQPRPPPLRRLRVCGSHRAAADARARRRRPRTCQAPCDGPCATNACAASCAAARQRLLQLRGGGVERRLSPLRDTALRAPLLLRHRPLERAALRRLGARRRLRRARRLSHLARLLLRELDRLALLLGNSRRLR